MNVDVHNGLPRSLTHIDAHIIATWFHTAVQTILRLPEQIIKRRQFFRSQLEEAGNMPPQDNERMAWRHGKRIPDEQRMAVAVQNSLARQLAEGTVIRPGIAHNSLLMLLWQMTRIC